MLFWFTRHLKSAELLMKENHGVQPLFKQRSAELKYQALLHSLCHNPDALLQLQQLQAIYKNKAIDVDAYYTALEEMEQQYLSH